MRIIDCFPFCSELDILAFRFAELDGVVDHHVLVETDRTFSGLPKELQFEAHKHDKYAKYLNRTIHVVVADMPQVELASEVALSARMAQAWAMEAHQRRSIDRGIQMLGPVDDDIILISDCDEVPDPHALEGIRQSGLGDGTWTLEQDLYYYSLTCFCPPVSGGNSSRARAMNYRSYVAANRDSQTIRNGHVDPSRVISRGGWHFCYFDGVDAILAKLGSYSHQEFNRPPYADRAWIQERIDNYEDLFLRPGIGYERREITDNPYLPKHYELLLEHDG